jgi:hypothetical protein
MSKHRRIVAVATMLVTCLAMAVSLCLSTAYAAPRTTQSTTPHSTVGSGTRHVVGNLSQSLKNYLHANPKFVLAGHPPMRTKKATSSLPQKGAKKPVPTVQGGQNLVYHGGPVLHNPAAVLIFWGPDWLNDPTTEGAQQVVETMFSDFGHTQYENVDSQYNDAGGFISNSLDFPLIFTDGSVPPNEGTNCPFQAVDDATLQAEVNAVQASFHFPSNDGSTTYFVFTESEFVVWDSSLGCSANSLGGNYCGYHNWDSSASESYAAMPFPDLAGCWAGLAPNGNAFGDALTSIAAHELTESVTDPLGNAWWESDNGFEIGDKCAWDFSGGPAGYTDLNNNGVFAIQTEYSNASGECVNAYVPDTVGAYIPGSPSFFCLRARLTSGGCDIAVPFGVSGDIPIVGDWTGKGYDSIGVYIPGNPSYFCLRNANAPGGCDIAIPFGVAGDIPVVGDWTGKGYDSIGVYIPGNPSYFCLRNHNTTGGCDIALTLGTSGDIPVVGDWFAQLFNTVGVWIPQYGFFCIRNANTTGGCSIATNFGGPGEIPVAGDTTDLLNEFYNTNTKYDTIGVWIASNGYYCLRYSNVTGPCDVATQFGSGSDIPLLGHWFYEGAGYETE